MRRPLPWLTLCAALGLSACTFAPHPRVPSNVLNTSKACARWRWIGVSRAGMPCPEIEGWKMSPMFPQLTVPDPDPSCEGREDDAGGEPEDRIVREGADRGGDGHHHDGGYGGDDSPSPGGDDHPPKTPSVKVLRELNRFCAYEIADPTKRLQDVPFPPAASGDLVRFDQDCAALALTDTTPDPATWTADQSPEDDTEDGVSEIFLTQAAGSAKALLKIHDQPSVRLAFLDTQPTGEGVPATKGRSLHGFILSRLARDLVCSRDGSGPCAALITTRLALPIIDFDSEDPRGYVADRKPESQGGRGGFLGTPSDLAEAIRSEVDRWRQTRQVQPHLVLNLSLAWDGELFGGLDAEQIADMKAGSQAVYRALQYAKGFDVLVLAAAGNKKKEPCESFGPLLPAAWEAAAPREERCRQGEEGPPLYAVGGLQADDSPLSNSRPGGMPRRAAYGVAKPFVGSSVATAVASSVAAVVWDAFPQLTSHEVMQILDGAGVLPKGPLDEPPAGFLPFKADFWFRSPGHSPGDAPAVRRVTLCTVLRQACQEHPSVPCPLVDKVCASSEPYRGTSSPPPTSGPVPLGSCQPWLLPQPEDNPCFGCSGPSSDSGSG